MITCILFKLFVLKALSKKKKDSSATIAVSSLRGKIKVLIRCIKIIYDIENYIPICRSDKTNLSEFNSFWRKKKGATIF